MEVSKLFSPLSLQVACPDIKETVKDSDILIFVLPHQVGMSSFISDYTGTSE